ncbi:hypothetical protein EDC01DRAFT_524432 [Geopyxis carbonaria]|nr:hypothetical protein EDC01DRAFT_524432 [Geopyxis carbonaria]
MPENTEKALARTKMDARRLRLRRRGSKGEMNTGSRSATWRRSKIQITGTWVLGSGGGVIVTGWGRRSWVCVGALVFLLFLCLGCAETQERRGWALGSRLKYGKQEVTITRWMRMPTDGLNTVSETASGASTFHRCRYFS